MYPKNVWSSGRFGILTLVEAVDGPERELLSGGELAALGDEVDGNGSESSSCCVIFPRVETERKFKFY